MTKYMTMFEAFKCDDNDFPFIDGAFNTDKDFTKKILLELNESDGFKPWPPPKDQLVEIWQVQKADPKVLTAGEIEEIARKQGPIDGIWSADHVQATVRNVIALCRKYFRLERDLDYKPIINAIHDCCDRLGDRQSREDMLLVLENLELL